ncbi:MAG: NAD(P)-dependent oxidoreductase [Solirubrobacterales bacterium]|nr:NAD(P)-dependent oxidoreductase [Solirubrobacterales bacterium]
MDLASSRIAVTGAGGFIGRATCARLAADGAQVVGVDLAPSAARAVEATGATFRLADTRDLDGLVAALDGCAGVVHTAAVVGDRGTMAEHVAVNVRGTRNVLDAADAVGAGRVVHVSSVATWGYEFHGDLPEDAAPRVCGAPYVDTKTASHLLALRRGATVVRPGDVYGPGSKPWTVRAVEALRAGMLRLPGRGEGIITPVYVDDLVDCLVRALVTPAAAGEAVTAHDGHPVTAREFFGRYAAMLGVEVRTAPRALLAAGAGALELVARARGREPLMTREALIYVSRHAAYPNARAREVLGWEPQVGLDEGMRRTEAWLRAEGLLA